jgi:hypothetical protein
MEKEPNTYEVKGSRKRKKSEGTKKQVVFALHCTQAK